MHHIFKLMAAIALLFTAAPAFAEAQVGQAAPAFTATDIDGNTVSLESLKGKTVVLEWSNHLCPFVMKHYETGNMQKTQQAAMDQGVTWITIVSSAEGRQGHVSAEEAKKIAEDAGAHYSHKILDESGEIGQAYGAKTTPHMFVINPEGTLVYAGAIDDNPSPRHETVEGAKNYVLAALDDLAAGKAVEIATSQPYGCAVKYNY
ncbi:MAG: thioredoxin family protein [Alphaproteobacteria bacterium]|nr:thioredoxin family protein [Alphaproteobacteria bacterium]